MKTPEKRFIPASGLPVACQYERPQFSAAEPEPVARAETLQDVEELRGDDDVFGK